METEKQPLSIYGQSFKTVAAYYECSVEHLQKNIMPIKKKLDAMIPHKSSYRNLLPKQVKLIIKHMEGEG